MPARVVRTLRLAAAVSMAALLGIWTGCRSTEPAHGVQPDLPEGAEALSLLGEPLWPPALPDELREQREAQLEEARLAYEADPNDLDAVIWYGRRTAYLGEYRHAVAIYTGGLSRHPNEPRLYRHRGHRYLTLRRFEDAAWDLERAARLVEGEPDAIEADGLPNARNEPRSTLQSNIWYHLGLAYYLQGRWKKALDAYQECARVSRNDDMLVATLHWLYTTLRRLERDDAAREALRPVHTDMDIIENDGYHRLLLMYKGEIEPDTLLEEVQSDEGSIEAATVAYGLANWYRMEGQTLKGEGLLEAIVESPQWAAFGYIAAEADLARLPEPR